jgi:Rrf2 family protein
MLSSRFTLAVHILALLVMHEEKPLSSTFISNSVNTNPVVVRRILGVLSKAGFVTTHLGVEGGAILARPPEQITLLEIYRVMEKGNIFALHHSKPNMYCPCGCNIQPVLVNVFNRAEVALEGVLSDATLAQVVQQIEARHNHPVDV